MGGNIFKQAQKIHINDTNLVINDLSKFTEIDLYTRTLGSFGKKEYSGDADFGITNEEYLKLKEKIIKTYSESNRKIQKNLISINYFVKNTGNYLQVDFIVGDINWLPIFYWSKGDDNGLKGIHRNLLLTAICSYKDRRESNRKDGFDRPCVIYRWKFAQDGFYYVKRESIYNEKHNIWIKKQQDTMISEKYTTREDIIKYLFNNNEKNVIIDSVYTLIEAIKRNFSIEEQEKIFSAAKFNYKDKKIFDNYNIPDEIKHASDIR